MVQRELGELSSFENGNSNQRTVAKHLHKEWTQTATNSTIQTP